jgi:hypothetical protein
VYNIYNIYIMNYIFTYTEDIKHAYLQHASDGAQGHSGELFPAGAAQIAWRGWSKSMAFSQLDQWNLELV